MTPPFSLKQARGATLCFMLTCALGLMSSSAWAFRCNSNVIDVGLHKAEVMKKCGAPSSTDSRIERRVVRLRSGGPQTGGSVEVEREIQITIEEWIYNFGPSQFMQSLTFENGKLVDVKDLGYGS